MAKRTFPSTIEVNLDGASRSTIIAAACVVMSHSGARAWDLGEWRQRAAVGTSTNYCNELPNAESDIAGAIVLGRCRNKQATNLSPSAIFTPGLRQGRTNS